MVTTLNMAVLLVLWMSITWMFTYMYMHQSRQKQIDVLEHHLREANSLIDDLVYHEMNDDNYAEYEVQEDGSWKRVY